MLSEGASRFYPFSPYCGAPPTPEEWAERWNLDPVLIAGLGAVLFVYWVWSRPGLSGARVRGWRRAAFYCGWAIGALALISPLCALSVSLFSARVAQHMLLATIAAPLIALGRPDVVVATRLARVGSSAPARRPKASTSPVRPMLAAAAFAGALWFWHSPAPYRATFESDLVYWLMHLSLFGAALWLWSEVLDGAAGSLAGIVAAGLLTTAQMAVLGAAITFSSRPLFDAHALTTAAWGYSPLEDQQLGGVIMWVPAGPILVAVLAVALTQTLRRAGTRIVRRPVT
jgi:putative membrane protein